MEIQIDLSGIRDAFFEETAEHIAQLEAGALRLEGPRDQVNESGKTLDGIVASVRKVTEIVVEISAASREQANGIEQVNKAMTQMDHVTQATASQTEELSPTAQSLAAHAQQLQAMVSRFRLETAGEARPVQHAQPVTPMNLPRPAALGSRRRETWR